MRKKNDRKDNNEDVVSEKNSARESLLREYREATCKKTLKAIIHRILDSNFRYVDSYNVLIWDNILNDIINTVKEGYIDKES